MPLKSKAQAAWMKANHPTMYKRWEKHTPKGELPPTARQQAAKAQLKKKKALV